jgi:rubrerythrin
MLALAQIISYIVLKSLYLQWRYPMVNQTLTPLEALHLAMQREKGAEDFYVNTARSMDDEGARKMFEFLAGEERKHQQMIQDAIDKNFLKEM